MTRVSKTTARRWWRIRFSLRALTLFLTLVCLYFGCWENTKQRAVVDVTTRVNGWNGRSPAPFVVGVDVHGDTMIERRYYVHCLGWMAQLPYARERPYDGVPMLKKIPEL